VVIAENHSSTMDSNFGKDVVVILDWYHLTQKLRNLMSMIVATKLTSKPISRFYSRIFGRGKWSSYQLLAKSPHNRENGKNC